MKWIVLAALVYELSNGVWKYFYKINFSIYDWVRHTVLKSVGFLKYSSEYVSPSNHYLHVEKGIFGVPNNVNLSI